MRLMYTPPLGDMALRNGEHEAHVEMAFECTGNPAGLKRVDAPGFQHFKVESITGAVARTQTGTVTIPTGVNVIAFNMSGTLMARAGANTRMLVVAPRSVTFIRGGMRLVVQAARGEHHTQLISWTGSITPLLDSWAVNRAGARSQHIHRMVACKPIDPHFLAALNRFEEARSNGAEAAEPLILGVVYEIVARLMMGADEVQLAATPLELPETIRELTQKVRRSPAGGWPLKEAADMAGYSPFHFSRVFKSLVGYGFHEYVDRCRTENAIQLLCTTDMAIDLIASTCGFGTTQGLRESVKEYLGLVPSELRNLPVHPDAAQP